MKSHALFAASSLSTCVAFAGPALPKPYLDKTVAEVAAVLPKGWKPTADVSVVSVHPGRFNINFEFIDGRIANVEYFTRDWHSSRDWTEADAYTVLKAASPGVEWVRDKTGTRHETFLAAWTSQDGKRFAFYNDLATGVRKMPHLQMRGVTRQGLTIYTTAYRDKMVREFPNTWIHKP